MDKRKAFVALRKHLTDDLREFTSQGYYTSLLGTELKGKYIEQDVLAIKFLPAEKGLQILNSVLNFKRVDQEEVRDFTKLKKWIFQGEIFYTKKKPSRQDKDLQVLQGAQLEQAINDLLVALDFKEKHPDVQFEV